MIWIYSALRATSTKNRLALLIAGLRWIGILESVRKHQAGLRSFRSMRRIEASRRNASALRLRFSQSLASLRQRLSQAMVRSTTQRRGSTTNTFGVIGALDDFSFELRQEFRERRVESGSLIAAVGK